MKVLLPLFFILFVFEDLKGQTKKQSKAESYFQLGYAEVDKGNYDKAITHFEKAIKSDPTGNCGTNIKGKAHSELGYAYFRTGDSAQAMVYYNRAIQFDKRNPYPRVNKAALLLMQKKNQAAQRELDALIATNPNFIDGYVQRGFIHHSENQLEMAKTDFTKALDLNAEQKILPLPLLKTIHSRLDEINRILTPKEIPVVERDSTLTPAD
ncbi:MAG TPA: tetratricopeptide repeat protein [Ohtaekwangia sp.]